MDDETGKKCGIIQDNPIVWYLVTTGSGTVVRTCSLPAEEGLLVPISGNECSYAEFSNLKSEAELRPCYLRECDTKLQSPSSPSSM